MIMSDAFASISTLDLKGGYSFIRYGKGNSTYSRVIEFFDGTTLRWNDDDFYAREFTGEDGWRGAPGREIATDNQYHPMNSKFFLAGKLELLDAPGEWFAEDGYLYLYPLDGMDPNKSRVLTQTQDYIIDQQKVIEDIRIEGIDFVATSLRFKNARSVGSNTDITLVNNHFSYIGGELLFIDRPQGNPLQKPIEISGENILIERCLFIGAEWSALHLKGENIEVLNNVFMENNRNAIFEARPLSLWPDGHYKISRNTFINNSSDAVYIRWEHIDIPPEQSEFSYNTVFNAGLYNSDVSGIYMPSRSQGYLEIHHNWFTRVNGNSIRLDISGKHLIAHHNVIWNSKRGLNFEGHGDFMIYNNTSVFNHEADKMSVNQEAHSKLVPAEWVANDYTFPPIGTAPNDNWYIYNNLVDNIVDWAKGREYRKQVSKKSLATRKTQSFPLTNRGSIQGNMMGFEGDKLFVNTSPGEIDLRPRKEAEDEIRTGLIQAEKATAPEQYIQSLGKYKGAYDIDGEYWYPGSDWLPYGMNTPTTMAEVDTMAEELIHTSIVPRMSSKGLLSGRLSQ